MTATTKPTAEQWQRAHVALCGLFGSVTMDCDGYRLTIEKRQINESNLCLLPYVNGEWKGAWLSTDCEERRRFMRPVKRQRYTGKFKKLIKRTDRILGSQGDINETVTYYFWDWPSFASLRRHLIKHNQSIRITHINGRAVDDSAAATQPEAERAAA
jgi:hypothetical protein